MTTVALALVSHTNVGKTTLARTLLARDVGEVRDAPHVTEFADEHTLIDDGGHRLVLWDTPGFGDSARLVRRLKQSDGAIGWLLGQVWDRFADRAFWSTQQAARAVKEHADVVLYLVNASESPEAAGYVGPEMELLAWLGRPVLVLLNQMGAPRPAAAEQAEVERWRRHLQGRARAVLPLDAFARCWVQEASLLEAVEAALDDAPARDAMAALRRAWVRRREAQFDAAVARLARGLGASAAARQALGDGGLKDGARRLLRSLGLPSAGGDAEAAAQQALAADLDQRVQRETADLIALHGLAGTPAARDAVLASVLARVAAQHDAKRPLSEGKAGLWGGLVAGALAGLKADVASGGLTMGGGLLAGGLLGALGAAGAARAVNLVRGVGSGSIAWSDEALQAMAEAALLRYLAVAHYGRGRGDWAAGEAPPHWTEVVREALAPLRDAVEEALSLAREGRPEADDALRAVLATALRSVLRALYPASYDPVA